MSSNLPLIQFNPKLPRLSLGEKAILKLLVEAGKLIAPLYQEQEKQAKESKLSKEEIEKAGKKDSTVLSPYTVVEKVNGKIIATPYHIKYAKYLKPISEKLNEAGKITYHKDFGRFLRLQAKALLEGSYDEATIVWLKMEPYKLDISIGPIDHFDNTLLYGRAPYQAWVGILDIEGTKRLNNYKAITLSATRKVLRPKEHINNLNKVKAKTIDVILFAGMMARTKFVGINLPMNVSIVEKYGAEVTIFNQPNDLRMKEQILPTFNKIFPKAFREGFSSEDLRRGYLRSVALHELAHSYLYYKNSARNLQDLFPCIYELTATVLGLRMTGSLLLMDRVTNKQLESMIVVFICRSFYHLRQSKIHNPLITYVLGGTIFINFMFEVGALKRFKGLVIPNFMKIFVSLHELSLILEGLLSQGTRKDAEAFIKKYA